MKRPFKRLTGNLAVFTGLLAGAWGSRLLGVLFSIVLGILLSVLLNGCGLLGKNIVWLSSNRPELAAYIEHFNAQNEDIKIQFSYREDPLGYLEENGYPPDLILSEWLAAEGFMDFFAPLEDLFKKERIYREDFYADLLASGSKENKQLLLPLSFNIPTVIFNPITLKEVPNLILPLDYLKEQSGRYNRSVRSAWQRMGFSPLWDRKFLYISCALYGTDFRDTGAGVLSWSPQALSEGITFLRDWVEEVNGGYAQEQAFAGRYMYEPLPKLLDEQRILFYLKDSRSLFMVLEEHEEETDFRWLGDQQHLMVDEEILYVGMPGKAKNKRGARQVLEWLYRPETQVRLLEINRAKRLKAFGIAGGFSALPGINEWEFPKFYPDLIGRVPAAELLHFPTTLPADWESRKREVIIPWLYESLVPGGEVEDLAARLRSY